MNFTRTAAIAALSLLALTACGTAAEPESAPADTPSPASSSAAAANIVQPETNELAGEGTAEGARAFLFHYFDLKSYALQTGDTAPMLEYVDGAAAAAVSCAGASVRSERVGRSPREPRVGRSPPRAPPRPRPGAPARAAAWASRSARVPATSPL